MAVVLGLASSLCYGLANYLGPLLTRRFSFGAALLVGQLAALASLVVIVLLAAEPALGPGATGLALLAGVGNAVGLAGFYRAAELGPISLAAPIGSTGVVLPVVYGVARGDALATPQAVGLVLAVSGIVLSARRPRATQPEPGEDLRACVVFAVLAAVGFGVFLIALPEASGDGLWWSLLDARIALVACVVLLVLTRAPVGPLPRVALPGLALPGLLLLAGTALYVLAAERGQLAVVSVLASLNPVVTVGLAFALLGERMSSGQAVGVTAALAGVVLMAG